jgi:hypothetical protein
MRLTIVKLGTLGWFAGLLSYLGALELLYGESISQGDLWFVIFSSLIAFALCYGILYFPILSMVRRWLPGQRWNWVFPVIAVLIGIVPAALIARFWGGSFNALVTHEALLFVILFTVVGLVVGIGFIRLTKK